MTTAYFGIKSTANTAQHFTPPTDTGRPPNRQP
jgi:hypothetical protein